MLRRLLNLTRTKYRYYRHIAFHRNFVLRFGTSEIYVQCADCDYRSPGWQVAPVLNFGQILEEISEIMEEEDDDLPGVTGQVH